MYVVCSFRVYRVGLLCPCFTGSREPGRHFIGAAQVASFDLTGATPSPPYSGVTVYAVFSAKPTAAVQFAAFGEENGADFRYTTGIDPDFFGFIPAGYFGLDSPFFANKWVGGLGYNTSFGVESWLGDGKFSMAVFQNTLTSDNLLGIAAQGQFYTGERFLLTSWQTASLDAQSAALEPASWAMMIAGFGVVGAAARRASRRRALLPAT